MIDIAQTILDIALRVLFAAWVLAATTAVLVFLMFVLRVAWHSF